MQIIIDISDSEIRCLEHDLLNIEKWVRDAVKGKINNCKKRLIQQEQSKLFNDPAVKVIPANEDELVAVIVKRSDYLNRAARDATELQGK